VKEETVPEQPVNNTEAIQQLKSNMTVNKLRDGIDLPQCYLCAKKHLSRAQIYFEEFHTGYPERIKLLVQSMAVAEGEVRKAFVLYCRTLAHMDMAAGEFLGNTMSGSLLNNAHIEAANAIREERLKFQDDTLYVPDFDQLLVSIQQLQYSE
jgi:hypothetical protein